MKNIGKALFVGVFVVSVVHAIMYKQWWAFAILLPIGITVEWNSRIKAKSVSTPDSYNMFPRVLDRRKRTKT
jgi:hypothetical protein